MRRQNYNLQYTKTYTQKLEGSKSEIFPLLCPVRERDWLDGWECEIIYSKSGINEEGCVFTTSHHSEKPAVWVTTKYDFEKGIIQFARVSEGEEAVKIDIHLIEKKNDTECKISYQYTALNPVRKQYLRDNLDNKFYQSMQWWEKAINYYLRTGEMLPVKD